MDNHLQNPTIEGSIIIEENIFEDLRGSFGRLFDKRNFSDVYFEEVKNINISKNNKKETIRGLHMQKDKYAETKIIFCSKGSIIDLFVDCRKESSTFGIINTIKLNSKKNQTLLIPRGCLHSFLTLEDNTEVIYLTDNYYSPENEISVSPLSKEIIENFNPYKIKICSEKDKKGMDYSEFFKLLLEVK
tara:strand:- start:2064 stop:2627 length:564 start_codon:yes stop_codon:yes gene_type:complete